MFDLSPLGITLSVAAGMLVLRLIGQVFVEGKAVPKNFWLGLAYAVISFFDGVFDLAFTWALRPHLTGEALEVKLKDNPEYRSVPLWVKVVYLSAWICGAVFFVTQNLIFLVLFFVVAAPVIFMVIKGKQEPKEVEEVEIYDPVAALQGLNAEEQAIIDGAATVLKDLFAPTSEPEFAPERLFPLEDETREQLHARQLVKNRATENYRLNYTKTQLEDIDQDGDFYKIRITLPPNATQKKLEALSEQIANAVHAYGAHFIRHENDPHGVITLSITMVKQEDRQEKLARTPILGKEFFAAHPAFKGNYYADMFSIPLGCFADGTPYAFALHQGSVTGRTGAGKGAYIQGLIIQLLPFIVFGTVRLWFGDPMDAEKLAYEGTGLLYRSGGDDRSIAELVFEFAEELRYVNTLGEGRKAPVTKERPVNILILDEATSLAESKTFMSQKNADGRTVAEELNFITLQGRKRNFFLIVAAQKALGEVASLMKNMPSRVALNIGNSTYEAKQALGFADESEIFDPEFEFPIRNSSAANGFRYSGIGNVVSSDGKKGVIRLAFTSDEEIDEAVEKYSKQLRDNHGNLSTGMTLEKPAQAAPSLPKGVAQATAMVQPPQLPVAPPKLPVSVPQPSVPQLEFDPNEPTDWK